jgi:acetylglutamate kinase
VDPSDAVLRFLEGVGRRSEAEFYLALFRAESKESFATLVIESAVLRQAFEAVVLDLRFLHDLALTPVVVLGVYGPGPATGLSAARLLGRLDRAGVPAEVLAAAPTDLAARVTACARSGRIPIVAFSELESPPVGIGARIDRVGALAAELRTRKLIFLSRRGGLRPRGAERGLPIINLATDYDALVGGRRLLPKQIFLLAHARHLLTERASHRMLVAVTSPLELLRELFTVKGAGTLIKRGSSLTTHDGYQGVDRQRLRALLESSFERPLDEQFFERPVSRVYLEETYRGAALITTTPLGAYLGKFAVEREAQGEGIGRDLWQLVVRDYPTLFWRARPENPINPWYTQECDGVARQAEWHVFWRALPVARIPAAIEHALAQPADFG